MGFFQLFHDISDQGIFLGIIKFDGELASDFLHSFLVAHHFCLFLMYSSHHLSELVDRLVYMRQFDS